MAVVTENMVAKFDDVYGSKFIMVTTFTKDGRPKPTAVVATPENGRILVFTSRDSWKIKRIRHTPRVTIATCTRRGRPTGEAVVAVAARLPDSETQRVYEKRVKQHGVLGGPVYRIFTRLGGGLSARAVIEIRRV